MTLTTEEQAILERLDWAHEGIEISKAIRKLRAGRFIPPHTGRHARNTERHV
jgi:hypothetical protein